MRVLCTGAREWTDLGLIFDVLKDLPEDTVVIEGCQRSKHPRGPAFDFGADYLVEIAASLLHYENEHYPAQWGIHGRGAGPIRNRSMYARSSPDVVFAFHDEIGKSKGTADMLRVAREGGTGARVFSHTYPTGVVIG